MSNRELVLEALNLRHYTARAFVLDAAAYGVRQRRRRVWFVAGLTMTAASLESFRAVLAAIGGVEPIDMTDTLLAESDPAVLKALSDGARRRDLKRQNPPPRCTTKHPKWPEQHISRMIERGSFVEWGTYGPSNDPDLHKIFPHIALLTSRELDILACNQVTFPEWPMKIIDISQSVSWTACNCEGAPCVTPHGRLWNTGRCRLLLGLEKLRLQGIYMPRSQLSAFPDNLLGDLAGDAFCASVCYAVLVALFVVSGEGGRGGKFAQADVSKHGDSAAAAEKATMTCCEGSGVPADPRRQKPDPPPGPGQVPESSFSALPAQSSGNSEDRNTNTCLAFLLEIAGRGE